MFTTHAGTIVNDDTGQLRVHMPQAIHTFWSITAAPIVTEIASFALFISKSSAFESFIFCGQTDTHIPHPLQISDCINFLSFAIIYDTSYGDMNISINTGVPILQVCSLFPGSILLSAPFSPVLYALHQYLFQITCQAQKKNLSKAKSALLAFGPPVKEYL